MSNPRELAIIAAVKDVGIPYVWGGNDPVKDGGLDCSGAVLRWLSFGGVLISDTTADGLRKMFPVSIKPRMGDLAFYGTVKAVHVVMVMNDGASAVIGANGGGRPLVGEKLSEYQDRMVRKTASVRIEDHRKGGANFRSDLLDFRSPFP